MSPKKTAKSEEAMTTETVTEEVVPAAEPVEMRCTGCGRAMADGQKTGSLEEVCAMEKPEDRNATWVSVEVKHEHPDSPKFGETETRYYCPEHGLAERNRDN